MREAPAYVQSTLRREEISQIMECCENGNDNNYLTARYTSNDRRRVSGSTDREKKLILLTTFMTSFGSRLSVTL